MGRHVDREWRWRTGIAYQTVAERECVNSLLHGAMRLIKSFSDSAQWIWHAGTMFYFQRWTQTSNGGRYDYYNGGGAVETSMISVRSYSLTRRPLFKLLEEAKKVYERTKPDMVTLRVLDQRGTWRKVAYRHKRPLTSIIMDEKERTELLHDAREFLSAESWYTKRGIPWKRGYLLHGSPGTGKSSTSLSGALKNRGT